MVELKLASARRESNLKERAHRAIRDAILRRDLSPGDMLAEQRIADQLGISRTPVREAIKALEKEGLLRSIPGKGVFVAETSAQDIVEIYQAREALECMAVRIAARTADPRVLEDLERTLPTPEQSRNADGDPAKVFQADMRIHQYIMSCTNNTRLIQMLSTLEGQVHQTRILAPRDPRRFGSGTEEHRAIIRALLARDPDAAEEAMRQHLRNGRDHALRLIMPQGAHMFRIEDPD